MDWVEILRQGGLAALAAVSWFVTLQVWRAHRTDLLAHTSAVVAMRAELLEVARAREREIRTMTEALTRSADVLSRYARMIGE